VEAALRFLYTASYPSPPAQELFSFHVKMFIFADRHGIPDLAKEAMRQYNEFVKSLAFMQLGSVSNFATAIELIETSCSHENEMRLDSLNLVVRCAKHLFGGSEDAQSFQTSLTDLPQFSVEVCKMLALASEKATPIPQPSSALHAFKEYGQPAFGSLTAPESASRTVSAGSLFGQNAPRASLFGQNTPSPSASQTAVTGQPSAQKITASSLFGAYNATAWSGGSGAGR
jgi:hypothetical protein